LRPLRLCGEKRCSGMKTAASLQANKKPRARGQAAFYTGIQVV
jgi:hypothetical protein